MYDIERYRQATSVADAIAVLVADPRALVISGGSDVLIQIREGKHAGCSLVSIHDLPELRGIRLDDDGTIAIGPAMTFAEITADPIIQRHIPVLGRAVDQAGGPQLRNIGTIGGNLCNGMTSADSAPTLLTLDAQLVITGPGGTRSVKQADFYAGPGRVHLQQGELLTEIRVPKAAYEGFTGHYIKYAMRNAMDIATLSCALHVRMEAGHIDVLKLAYGVAGPVPMRCPAAEAAVQGRVVDEATLALLADAAAAEVRPRDSWRASRAFRLQLVRELCQRALLAAIDQKGGERP